MIQLIRNIRKWISVRRRKTYEDWLVKQEIMPGTVERYLKIRDEYVGMQVKEYGMFRFYMRVFPLSEGRVLAFLKEKKSTQLYLSKNSYSQDVLNFTKQPHEHADVCLIFSWLKRDTKNPTSKMTVQLQHRNCYLPTGQQGTHFFH